jgi:Ca2+-binding RTX toxin-like protein
MTVTPVNDAPVNNIVIVQRAAELATLTIAGASVFDADAPSVQVTLAAGHGVLSLAPGSAASLAFAGGDGVSDAKMIFTGAIPDVNVALGNLTYQSESGFAGKDTILLTTSDLGWGTGVALTDSDSIEVFVAANGPIVRGGPRDDLLLGAGADDSIVGSGGADTILGDAGDDWLEGEDGNDPLPVGETPGADTISGGAGNDTILAGGGNDQVHGDAGNDTIVGEAGADVIYGDEGYDAIDGGEGGDVLYGGTEADILFGAADNDTLYGGEGDDIMMGERGEDNALGVLDILYGEAGNDLMHGGGGNDWIFGADGADVIDGGFGSDLIVAGPGADILLGSGASQFTAARDGNDLFVYTGMVDAGDRIWGFDARRGDADGIDLRALFDNIGYAGTTPRLDGVLSVSEGARPTDAVVSIDTDGGGDAFGVLLTVHGVTPASLTDAFFLFQ